MIAEYEDGQLVWKFIYGLGIDEPIIMIDVTDSNAVYYYHFDGLGSVIALSNNSGEIVEQYEYDVFGRPDRVSDVNNPYFFTGRRYDDETGLYYYRARYYDPYIGRFLQTDPVGYAYGLNLYTYVGNNPINWVDPYGEWWVWDAFKTFVHCLWKAIVVTDPEEIKDTYKNSKTIVERAKQVNRATQDIAGIDVYPPFADGDDGNDDGNLYK